MRTDGTGENLFREPRPDEARAHGVHANLPGTQLVGGCVQNPQDAGLARVVGDEHGFSVVRVGGCGDDDGAAAARFHSNGGGLHRVKYAAEIQGDDAIPVLDAGFVERRPTPLAGIGDNDIRRPATLEGRVNGGAIGDIHDASVTAERRPNFFGLLAFDIEDPDARSSGSQRTRRSEANTVCAAGDHGQFSTEIERHLTFLSQPLVDRCT